MYKSLASFVSSCSTEEVPFLYLEDIAICATWYESYEEDEGLTAEFSPLRQVFDRWVREVKPPPADTEGYRQQPLIRELLADLAKGHIARLERDELDLIYFAVNLAKRCGNMDVGGRVVTCVGPYIEEIERIRKNKPLIPGCPNLAKRLAVVTEEDLRKAKPRDVSTFGGLSLPIRGPVLIRTGNLKVMSSIPPNLTAVVDQGSCCVRGNVEGNLAATESCDVRGNISGVVVARRGGVNAKNILNQAVIVSKEDSVRALGAESPKSVFAAREIHIKGTVTGGRYMARVMEFRGEMHGGDLFVTERAEAPGFLSSDQRPLRVCLLRGLSCKDYGEVLTMESELLLNSAMKLRQRLNHLEELAEIAEREADDFAGNILMYVLGEGDTKERVESIQNRRRRLSFLDRLLAGVRALVLAAEDRLNNCEDGADESEPSAEDRATLEDLRRELSALSNEGAVAPDLQEEKEEVLYLGRKLQGRKMEQQGLQQVMGRLLARGEAIQELADAMSTEILDEESGIEKAVGREELLERARAECSRVEMYKQLSSAARKRPSTDVFKQRLNGRQVRLLQRTMENRCSRVTSYSSMCQEIHDRIEVVREKLWGDYMVSLPDHVLQGWAVGGAQIQGSFSGGVLICAWRHLMSDPDSRGKNSIFTKPDSSDTPTMRQFTRSPKSTIEEARNTEEKPKEESATTQAINV
jgi:hypothetical protein